MGNSCPKSMQTSLACITPQINDCCHFAVGYGPTLVSRPLPGLILREKEWVSEVSLGIMYEK
jgi:hypothetical protein